MSYEKIPDELKKLPNWVCWKLEEAEPKPRKVPVNAKTGGGAMSNNPNTWCDFNTAIENAHKYSGIGFMFDEGYIGVDIDDVSDEIEAYKNGEADNIVSEFVHSCQSYAEISTSGNGVHIICRGTLPDGRKRKGNIEIYTSGRYFIMTGDSCSPYSEIAEGSETVKYLRSKYLSDDVPAELSQEKHDLDTETIIEKALGSKQGMAFRMLYEGLWSGAYGSQSDADMAFCNMLAFWTACDAGKMDEIFRKSRLFRGKWDERRRDSTYGRETINKAIKECQNVFVPRAGGIEEYSITIAEKQPVRVRQYAHDDTGNADRFVFYQGDNARYSYPEKAWYIWNGKQWKHDGAGNIKALAENVIKQMRKERESCSNEDEEKAHDKHVKMTRSSRGKENMIKESMHRLAASPDEFDQHNDVVNVANGIINLRNGELADHDRNRRLSKISNVEYTDKIDCPQWREFLSDIFAGDEALMRYVQKAVGYSLSGSTREQCMFFCYGTGSNGKSTFLDVIRDIMGDYAANTQADVLMINSSRSGGPTPELARLKGARFVTTNETNEGVRLDEALIKQLTGGDVITTRFLYGKDFEYKPTFKIWMATNHKPIIRGRDMGIWRRIHLIPFNVCIPDEKKDRNLAYKLRKELPAIMNWAVEGCMLWQREGLKMPPIMQAAANEYKSEMDVVYAFLKQCTHEGPGETKASDLFSAYLEWARENNEYKMSGTKFSLEIGERYKKIKNRDGNYYIGVRLNENRLDKKYVINY